MKLYHVSASSLTATYSAGKFIAESPEEAKQKAKDRYRNSSLGRTLKDVGAFHFYITKEEKVDG